VGVAAVAGRAVKPPRAGASYADVRCSRQRQNFVFTREQQIQNVVDTDTVGIGVRALVDGTWGFAGTRILTTDGAAAAAREAVAIARASKVARANAHRVAAGARGEQWRLEECLHAGSRSTCRWSRRPICSSGPTPMP
jgi:predicted Zn-dependent protease